MAWAVPVLAMRWMTWAVLVLAMRRIWAVPVLAMRRNGHMYHPRRNILGVRQSWRTLGGFGWLLDRWIGHLYFITAFVAWVGLDGAFAGLSLEFWCFGSLSRVWNFHLLDGVPGVLDTELGGHGFGMGRDGHWA